MARPSLSGASLIARRSGHWDFQWLGYGEGNGWRVPLIILNVNKRLYPATSQIFRDGIAGKGGVVL